MIGILSTIAPPFDREQIKSQALWAATQAVLLIQEHKVRKRVDIFIGQFVAKSFFMADERSHIHLYVLEDEFLGELAVTTSTLIEGQPAGYLRL